MRHRDRGRLLPVGDLLQSGPHRLPLTELELELKLGAREALYDLAIDLAGRWPFRIEWQTKAMELKRTDESFRRAATQRLNLYRAGKPYREAAGE